MIDGNLAIKIISSKELELAKDSARFVCEYSRDGDRVRVVITVLGTKQAVYFTITPEGLRAEDGTMLYSPDRYEQVMRQEAANARLLQAAQQNDAAAVAAALNEGAKPNEVRGAAVGLMGMGGSNYAPLHFAADKGNTGMVTLLLDSGENINAQEERGRTPLMLALSAGKEQVVRLLVARGADRSKALGMARGDRELQRWLRTDEEVAKQEAEVAKQEAEDRLTIVSALKSGNGFFGEAIGQKRFGFQIKFESFDEVTGRFSGIMNYYPSDDKSILTVEGSLDGATLKFWHTGIIQKGVSVPRFEYTFRLSSKNEKLVGIYARKDSRSTTTGDKGETWIDLNEARRSEMERKLAEFLIGPP